MTRGGIVTNGNMEMLDTKGNVMPGLFAGGVDASPSGGGMRIGRAQTQGYYAGQLLGKYLKNLG